MMFFEPRTVQDFVRLGAKRFARAKLSYGHGTGNAFDEAAFMVLEGLGLPPWSLLDHWKRRVTPLEKTRILALFDQRIATRKPASYILNKAYLEGFSFYVDERVIVPRSYIAEILSDPEQSPVANPAEINTILDLCTGSGCLAIIAAKLFPDAQVDAVELSQDAFAVAQKNVGAYGLTDRVHLYQGDLFAPLPQKAKYDLIITNPPYVDAGGMAGLPPEYRAEPEMALAAGEDGLDLVHRILKEAPNHLTEGGFMICEIGRCGPALQDAYPHLAFAWCETLNSNGEVFYISREELLGDHA